MANLTLQIDEDVLRRARIRALEQGTSVNALVRDFLRSLGDLEESLEVRHRIVERSRSVAAGSGSKGREWTRDEIHDRTA